MSLIESISHRKSFVSEDVLLDDIVNLIADSDLGVVGVTKDGKAVGTITNREILMRTVGQGQDLSTVKAKHVMESRLTTIEWPTDDSDLIDAAITMQRHKAYHAVVTHDGVPIGLISYGALMRYNLRD